MLGTGKETGGDLVFASVWSDYTDSSGVRRQEAICSKEEDHQQISLHVLLWEIKKITDLY